MPSQTAGIDLPVSLGDYPLNTLINTSLWLSLLQGQSMTGTYWTRTNEGWFRVSGVGSPRVTTPPAATGPSPSRPLQTWGFPWIRDL